MSRLTRGLGPLLALLLVLASVAGAAAQDDEGEESGESGLLGVTRSVDTTVEDLAPARTYASPYFVVSPDDPLTIIGAASEMRSRVCSILRSADGGLSWSLLDAAPSPESFPFCFHTSGITTLTPMAFGRDARLYLGMGGYDVEDTGNVSVVLSRSDDLGDTWESTVVRNTRETDAPENNRPVTAVAVDTTSGDTDVVYVGWQNRPMGPDSGPSVPVVAVSTDAGETFGEPINIVADFAADQEDGEMIGGNAPEIAVTAAGVVHALFLIDIPETPRTLYLARSDDRGESWTYTEFPEAAVEFSIAPDMLWSPEGGAEGTLHMVYEDNTDTTDGDRNIFYRRSTDGGETVSDAVRLNDDVDEDGLLLQATPQLSLAANGRVDVAWFDFRDDPGDFVNDVYATYSTDNGQTWAANVRVSDQSINRRIGTWSNGFDMRGPPGVASTDGLMVVGWDDTRLGDELTQTTDVFAASLQFEPIAAETFDGLRYAIAVLAGLAIAGLFLLLYSRFRTPPRGTPVVAQRVPEPKPKEPTPVG